MHRIQTFSHEKGLAEVAWHLSQKEEEEEEEDLHPHYAENYDLQGHTVTNVALAWKPWLGIGECRLPPRGDCVVEGILVEVMDALAAMYNFTWRLDLPEDNKWGSAPK